MEFWVFVGGQSIFKRLILAYLNINSIRNKFDQLVNGIEGNIDVLMISETKLEDYFPSMQFLIEGYGHPYRLDRNSHGGSILVYVPEDIPCKTYSSEKM